jgi:hypothetical protein
MGGGGCLCPPQCRTPSGVARRPPLLPVR